MIIRYDGVIPTRNGRKALIGITDIFATVCDFAGVDMPEYPTATDSISFADFLKIRSTESFYTFRAMKIVNYTQKQVL